MRVWISIDMEGIAGVADAMDTTLGAPHYEYCRRLMTAECNAAIDGCFEGGATDVVVNDSHGTHTNLLQDELDTRARVVRGRTKPFGMAQGLGPGTDAAMFVGYHARAGGGNGVLHHTMRGREVLDVFLNGEPAGELRLNAAFAGAAGVPVALVTGDDVLCQEARACLGDVETVEVKEAIDKYVALSVHPKVAQERIREGAARALRRVGAFRPYTVDAPTVLRVECSSSSIAALCEGIPGTVRVGARAIEHRSGDYRELYRLLRVFLALASSVTSSPYTYD